jgi:hypothetical protein
MSRRANCWDNASMENFFGYLKEEYLLQFKKPPPLNRHSSSLKSMFTLITDVTQSSHRDTHQPRLGGARGVADTAPPAPNHRGGVRSVQVEKIKGFLRVLPRRRPTGAVCGSVAKLRKVS